ncbi:NAD(P)H-dependent oxidoreductase [Streptomyces sp. B-S-A8]|uniref:NAD(P)H-dependent oxidoreductase n=1 Tax=Streptomyces solicavernae TaxID=3043614 RepID=A0ABT6S0N9_9ACTN|nr:NAD(P)H-dependent oxidoreductase [Streptomyces sp. B-S-A8]MDI3390252.1 NAD(P)H-dependent oxidoreductase [Streptomyces sp. B-S-A8]
MTSATTSSAPVSASTPAPASAPVSASTPGSAPGSVPVGGPLRVAVILGSDRHGRFGPVIADWLLSRVRTREDLTVEVVDVAAADLPTVLSPDPEPAVRDRLARVAAQLDAAEAFVVVTPEYNHSFPAALKNLIDRHRAEWQAKPVAFVSYGGISGGLRAVEQLRQVFAELHAVTVRDTVSFHGAQAHFDDAGNHLDPAGPDAAAKVMLDQLAWWGHALRDAKAVRPYGR